MEIVMSGFAGRSVPTRALWLVLAACTSLSCVSCLAPPALASIGKPPKIETLSVAIGGEVIVGAKINPEGLETAYEILLECPSTVVLGICEPQNAKRVGLLAASDESSEVSFPLIDIQPGSYSFSVLATNSVGGAFWLNFKFVVPPVPLGACPTGCSTGEPYKPEVPSWSNEELNRVSIEAVKEVKETIKRSEAEEQAELQAKNAALRAIEEQSLKRLEAEEQTTAAPITPACLVPSLTGDTLSAARRTLEKAHCRLGKVNRPRHARGTLHVTGQSPTHGKKGVAGETVTVTLGPVQSKHNHRT